MKHRVVLKPGTDDMFFPLFRQLMGGALDGPVVRLAAAGGEENFAGLRVEAAGNVLPGGFHRLFRVPTHGIQAGWIAVVLSIIRKHGFHHGLRYRGSG